jgi:phosphatidylglycerol:prolipoprotein diacylglycerol transferase
MTTWSGPFVHAIDPVIGEVGGVYLWYYGLSYSLGFLGIFWWLRRLGPRLGLGHARIYELAIAMAAGILAAGRAVEVLVYEWPYYRAHPQEVLYYWQGGMSSHGLLLGGALGAWLFCRARRRGFLEIAGALTIPAALLLALGRLGNFVDGQIVGSVTTVWWGVRFPDAEGVRHPVVLYEALKNLLLVPLLLRVPWRAPAGRRVGHFVLWYGALRIPVDLFREYPTAILGIGTGQWLNMVTVLLGAGLLAALRRWPPRARSGPATVPTRGGATAGPATGLLVRRVVLAALVAFPLLIPSDWTQDVPARYGKRHPITASWLYRSAGSTDAR